MIARLQNRTEQRDKGFTLVELLIVIVIIGLLAGIAIPMFLAQRRKGVDAGVKSDIKNVSTAMETYYVEERGYTAVRADVEAAGDPIELGEGNEIRVVVDSTDDSAYCIVGFNADGNHDSTEPYFYASNGGGLKDEAETGTACASATATTGTDWTAAAPTA